jgi:hypothetical protein
MLSVIMLSVIMLSVIMLSVIMLSVIMLSVIMLIVIMLSVIMLSVIMLFAVIMAPIYSLFWLATPFQGNIKSVLLNHVVGLLTLFRVDCFIVVKVLFVCFETV